MTDIPADFILSHPALCGEALTRAWEAHDAQLAEWTEWFRLTKLNDNGDEEMVEAYWAGQILTRLRELGYRRVGKDAVVIEGGYYDVEQYYKDEPDPAAQMAPDAKCPKGHEFAWESAEPVKFTLNGAIGRLCPACCYACDESAKAAHQPAEPAARPLTEAEVATISSDPLEPFRKPAETPAPDEVEGLAMKLKERFALAASTNDGWRYVAAAVLRREREARYGELQRAMAHVPMSNEQAEWFVSRINELKGGE